ncbi:RICIN domain-containing protein [Chryseobacterium sp. ES2]|uniref:RICIN domain-containing protein n=1 Tax=Chryseobacterium metallicongregator TaxID=3073042 RepID=A0ABU1DZP2_9FLAO|nr:RICIN domain-containing protein [Chryseobacterium sp. ES2]MDR4951020.1 RICIN domain-containing protein [Chryseobacterium sp. ES2]
MKKIIINVMLCGMGLQLVGAQQVNVNCPEGAALQKQKDAVVKFSWNSVGSLINNGDGKIYLLTSRTAMNDYIMGQNIETDLTFGAENTTCTGGVINPPVKASVIIKPVARSYQEPYNYAVAEVITDLSTIPGLDLSKIYLNGWDRQDTAPQSGAYIGFPNYNDTKKIGTFNKLQAPVIYDNSKKLIVTLIPTVSGYQGASNTSGSPIFDENKRTKAVVYNSQGQILNPSYTQKEAVSITLAGAWQHGESINEYLVGKTLQSALDPNNTSLEYTNGIELTEMRRIVNGPKYLINKKSGYVFTINTNGDLIQKSTSGGSNTFTISTDMYGYYKFKSQSNNVVIGSIGTNAGSKITAGQNIAYPNDTNQRFRILPTGSWDGTYYIQDVRSGLNLTIEGSSNDYGAKIVLGTKSGAAYEEWFLGDAPGYASRNSVSQNADSSKSISSISVYPAPAVDYLNVKVSSDKKVKAVSVVNTMGREVFHTEQISLEGQSVKINVQKLMTGNYMVNVVFTDGSQSSAKFLKK